MRYKSCRTEKYTSEQWKNIIKLSDISCMSRSTQHIQVSFWNERPKAYYEILWSCCSIHAEGYPRTIYYTYMYTGCSREVIISHFYLLIYLTKALIIHEPFQNNLTVSISKLPCEMCSVTRRCWLWENGGQTLMLTLEFTLNPLAILINSSNCQIWQLSDVFQLLS